MGQAPILAAAGLLLLAGCGPQDQADPAVAPTENEAVTAQSAATAASVDRPGERPSTGSSGSGSGPANRQQWFTKTTPRGPWAGYGPPFSEAAFSVRCEREAARLVFSTTEMPPSRSGRTTMQLTAAGLDRTLGAEASEDGLPSTDASVDAGADWLARLASATGDLEVRVDGSDALIVPISDPLRSLIDDCARQPAS